LNLTDNVKFLSKVSEDDLVFYYNCSSGLIFPSLYEGFGFPLLESMACGTLVAASNIDIFKELGGGAPFYFNPRNEKSLIEALNLLTIGDKNKIELGLQISKKYTWKSAISKTLDTYDK
ncbi:MAG: glycosyltransferase, partial [Patescibacteria group bacterium]|nr:glycosyltransferase [Patescibacteria group bacterium]